MKELYHGSKSQNSSFLITIRYQENNSWQGTIQWLDQNRVQHFRSALEMIKLIDEAVSKEGGVEVSSRTWINEKRVATS